MEFVTFKSLILKEKKKFSWIAENFNFLSSTYQELWLVILRGTVNASFVWRNSTNGACLIVLLFLYFQIYPKHDIRNIVESSNYVKISNWCKVGHAKCKHTDWVKPYRCLGESNFWQIFRLWSFYFSSGFWRIVIVKHLWGFLELNWIE